MKRIYSQEHIQFIAANIAGRSYKELTGQFNMHFGLDQSIESIIRIAWKNGLRNGIGTGKETRFKQGNKPWNYKPVGTERINTEGYVDVKIADPRTWKQKHILIW